MLGRDRAVAEMKPGVGQQVRDCWTVAFGNSYNGEERCVVAGYDNGDVKMLDLKTNSLRWESNIKVNPAPTRRPVFFEGVKIWAC